MKAQRLGLLGLAVVMASFLAACDDDEPIQPEPTPDINVSVLPETFTLDVGQTQQLTAVVTGTTNQAVTWAANPQSIATVSATGVVTAVAPGQAVITATSQADPTQADGATVTVRPPVAPPTIVISAIRQNGATVNPANVVGQIEVIAELTVPEGAQVSRVEFLLDNAEPPVCTQDFSSAGSEEISTDATAAPVECVINTAAFNATTGAVTWQNGPHTVSARVIQPNGTVTASSGQTLNFNNKNFIVASLGDVTCATSGTNARSIGGPGTLWCAGDLAVSLVSVNFGPASSAVASATVLVSTSGAGVNGAGSCTVGATLDATTNQTIATADGGAGPTPGQSPGCPAITFSRQDTDASNGLAVTFPANATPTAAAPGVQGIEDVLTIMVNSVTVGGQAGPTCVNPDPGANPLATCGVGGGTSAPNQAFFANPLRWDNLAPRITLFDLTPSICQTPSCFVNAAFTFTTRTGFYASVDYGVDSQNANTTFAAGSSATALETVTSGADLNETVTSNDLFLRASATDGLGNVRLAFPTTTNTTTTTSATAGTLLKFGVDKTPPIVTNVVAPANNGANDGTTFVISFADNAPAGAGPSGFGPLPVIVKVEQITPSGTTCLNPSSGAAFANCGATAGSNGNGFEATPGNWNIGATTTQAYYRVTYFLIDAAGNATENSVVLTLLDTTAPAAGAISGPSIITGASSVTFTSSVSDNLDLGDVRAVTNFGALVHLQEAAAAEIGTYGPDAFTTSATATATLPSFIRSIENGLGGGITQANGITLLIRDQAGVVDNGACPTMAAPNTGAGNCFNRQDNIAAAVVAGITASNPQTAFATTGMTTYTSTASELTVCNGDNAGGTQTNACPTNPITTTLTAAASGPSATFGNPFQRVNFYYNLGGTFGTTASILIGTATSPSVTDVAGVRTFTWSLDWTPNGFAPGGYATFALGVDAKGQGLANGVTTITITVD